MLENSYLKPSARHNCVSGTHNSQTVSGDQQELGVPSQRALRPVTGVDEARGGRTPV